MKIVRTLITLMVMIPLLVVAKDKDDSLVYRISVLPGQTLEQTVSSGKQFKSFELVLHPEIESWVSVTKAVETKSSKHKGKSLVIALTVPEVASPGVYLSQVYFDKKPSKKSKSLTVELEVLEPVISLPPEPGNENDTTVEGIDSDADGVRDDVQRYIYFEYAGQPSVQLALMDVARSLQSALIGAESREEAYQSRKAFSKAYTCMYWIDKDNTSENIGKLEANQLNTRARTRAYDTYHNSIVGTVITRSRTQDQYFKNCSFDALAFKEQ